MLIPCLYLVCGLVACQKGARQIPWLTKNCFCLGAPRMQLKGFQLSPVLEALLEILTAQLRDFLCASIFQYEVEEAALLSSTGYAAA